MTNGKHLDQTICNLPFEVIAIYDNGSQILQQSTNSTYPKLVNVKIRIRNKEDFGKERRGIISLPKLTTKNWPKRVRLVNSDQTIMSFNLALEPNSDEVQKKSNRKLFQIFRPGGCLSSHRDEDGYSYMPSTSNDLKRTSSSGIEDYQSNIITGAFSLKKNDFSSSYTNTLKTPKTFLGKCKPGGCLDPPFSEDKYSYKPTAEEVQTLQKPAINTNLLHPDLNMTNIKVESITEDQNINILHHSQPETKILENTAMLITYPSTLSSSKLKTKGNQNRKSSIRIRSDQMELTKKFNNEFPEAYFIPPRKEKHKQDKDYDKHNYDEKEPQIRESYVNKDYIVQSQTPSELLSDIPTIKSSPDDNPLPEVIKEKQVIKELNPISSLLLKSEGVLSSTTSKDNIKTYNKIYSAEGIKTQEKTLLQDQNSSYHNNILMMEDINIAENKNVLNKDVSRLSSSIKLNAIQKATDDINIKNKGPNNDSDSVNKHQSVLQGLALRNEILTKPSQNSIDQSSIPIDNFKVIDRNNVLRQRQDVSNNEINKTDITDVKQQLEVGSEDDNNINVLKLKKEKSSLEFGNVKNVSGRVTSNEIIINDPTETNYSEASFTEQSQGDDRNNNLKSVSKQFENISEPTKLLVQELEFIENNMEDNIEDLSDNKIEKTSNQIIDIQPFVVSEHLSKVTSLNSSGNLLALKKSYSSLTSPKSINVNPEDSLLNITKSKELINKERKTDESNEKLNISFDNLENALSNSVIKQNTSSQNTEINTTNTDFNMSLQSLQQNLEISSKHERLDASDITLISETLPINYLSRNVIESDNDNQTKSQHTLSITQIQTLKTAMELTETVVQSRHELTGFDPSTEHKTPNNRMSKNESTNFGPFINDSEMLLPFEKYERNISKQNILYDDKSTNELTNNKRALETISNSISYPGLKKNIDELERKESAYWSQNVNNNYSADLVKLKEDSLSIIEKHFFLKDIDRSRSTTETSEKKTSKTSHNFDKVQELKTRAATPENDKSFKNIKKNINSMSSIAINFGFHTSTNEEIGPSIGTFDPSTNLANYPQDNIFTINTILRKNDSEIKIQIDSETDLTMQIKSTKQLNGSRKYASNVLNDIRRNNIRVHTSEILINKDEHLQETLKELYETLIPIEKNIINLKDEADLLHREHLCLKEVLFSKKIKQNKIITPNIRTCSCLRREIGLE